MGKTLTPEQEAEQLRAIIREAHEVLGDLRRTIKEASTLVTRMISGFEQLHAREMAQLSNHLQAEANRAAAQLEEEVQTAQQYILKRLTAADLTLDLHEGVAVLHFPAGMFDDQIPAPYPADPSERTPR